MERDLLDVVCIGRGRRDCGRMLPSCNGKPNIAAAGKEMAHCWRKQTLICSPSGWRCNDMNNKERLCDAQGTCGAEKALEEQTSLVRD